MKSKQSYVEVPNINFAGIRRRETYFGRSEGQIEFGRVAAVPQQTQLPEPSFPTQAVGHLRHPEIRGFLPSRHARQTPLHHFRNCRSLFVGSN
jgi:hypothetical protein